jgi:hypothetical protein
MERYEQEQEPNLLQDMHMTDKIEAIKRKAKVEIAIITKGKRDMIKFVKIAAKIAKRINKQNKKGLKQNVRIVNQNIEE